MRLTPDQIAEGKRLVTRFRDAEAAGTGDRKWVGVKYEQLSEWLWNNREALIEEALHGRQEARLEVRALIHEHAKMTWNTGQIERSDGITEVLVEFDNRWNRK